MSSSNNARTTKADRREAAREKARQIREEQERREKRNRMLLIGGVVVFLVVVGIAVWSIVSAGNEPVIEEVNAVPANTSVDDGGISVGPGLAAGSTAGDDAPVIDIYLDYTCIHCSNLEDINAEDLSELADSGDATVVYHPIALLDQSGNFTGYSGRAVHAIGVVADQAPEQFTEAQTALFTLYDAAREAGGAEPDQAAVRDALVEAGVPQDVAEAAAPDDVTTGEFADWVQATTDQARNDDITGTPTVYIDGEEFTGWTEQGAFAEAVRG